MGKPFEVKEFDSIICNADYKDDEKYKYLNQKEFENLVAFIHEFTGDADSADALDFMKIGYRRNVGEVVSIKNYVGLIQMKNGFQHAACDCQAFVRYRFAVAHFVTRIDIAALQAFGNVRSASKHAS